MTRRSQSLRCACVRQNPDFLDASWSENVVSKERRKRLLPASRAAGGKGLLAPVHAAPAIKKVSAPARRALNILFVKARKAHGGGGSLGAFGVAVSAARASRNPDMRSAKFSP